MREVFEAFKYEFTHLDIRECIRVYFMPLTFIFKSIIWCGKKVKEFVLS